MADVVTYPGTVPAVIREARQRFRDCAEAEDPQRKSSLEAKRFLALDQWPEDIKIQRQGGIAIQGQPAQPPRPCLTLDCVSEPHQQVINAIKQADFAVKVSPKLHASDDTAEVIAGLMRHIQQQARTDDPIGWAADNAAGSGIGWFGVRSDYIDDTSLDQELCLYAIENCLSVYRDPSVSLTSRDARFMFVTEDVPKDEFKLKYKDADMKSLEDFRATGDDSSKDWVTEKTIRVANYWHVDIDEDTLYEFVDGTTAKLSELKGARPDKAIIANQRKVFAKRVVCDTITACEVLDTKEWGGTTIPLIPIAGQKMNVDGHTIYFGVTQRAIGPQMMVNFTYSGVAETMALAPKAPFTVAEGQFESYEDIWQNANRYNYSYLPYRRYDDQGRDLGTPERNQAEPPIQAGAAVMQMSLDAVRRTTSFDPALGQMPGRQMSADAIEALQAQGQKAQSGYLDSVKRAYIRLGEILLEAIPVYYDRPGRIIQILDLEDAPSQVMVNQPHVETPNGPQAVQDSQPQPQGADVKHFDLTKGRYAVTVDVGRDFTTRRQEGVAALGEFAKVAPELVPKYSDLWVKEMDFPGAQAVAKRLEPPGVDDSPLPPEVQAAMQSLQQENQQLKLMIATKQPELDAKKQIAALETQADLQMAREKNQADLTKAELSASATMAVAQAKVDAENFRSFVTALEVKLAHDAKFRLHVAETLSQGLTAQHQHAHELGMAKEEHAHQLAAAEQAADHAVEAAKLSAALTPAPTEA